MLFGQEAFAQPCSANAGPDVTICQGESVVIGGSPTAVNACPGVSYDWSNSGSLNDDELANPTASPNVTTTYTVELSGCGCGGEEDQVTVFVLPAPSVTFTFAPNSQCASTPVAFNSTANACPSCDYDWDFDNPASGGSNSSSIADPSHTFVTSGTGTVTFDVSVTVTAQNGCTDTFTDDVQIDNPPNAVLLDPITNFQQCTGDGTFPIEVYDGSTPANNSSYSIDWESDGTIDWTSNTPPLGEAFTYTSQGAFQITYTVTGTNGCSDTQVIDVFNVTNPGVGVGSVGSTTACGPVEFCFNLFNYQANHPSTVYTIDYGDGSPTITVNHPSLLSNYCHTYTNSSCPNNFYTFTITATNGCASSIATVSPVKVGAPPAALFTATPQPACAGSAVTMVNQSFNGYGLSNCNSTAVYAWNFGDPASGASNTAGGVNLGNQSHVYALPGNYNVTLTLTNPCGTDTYVVPVCIETPPTPQFTIPSPGCNPFTAATVNTSLSGTPCSVSTGWNVTYSDLPCAPNTGTFSFIGGTSASSLQPQFSFQSVGVYTVNLNMTNSCGTFTDSETVTVNTTPIVDINPIANFCSGNSVTPAAVVNGCNLPITNYAWSFPGGNPATANTQNPGPVTYAVPGPQTITLTITNACGTATTTETFTVVAPPVVAVNPTTATLCSGQSAALTASGASTYSWTPGAGLNTTSGPNVTASPTSTTTYTVTGFAALAGCSSTAQTTVTVNPVPVANAGPNVAFCAGQNVQLIGTANGGTAPYVSTVWSPAAGLSNATILNPVASPATTQNYTLTVTDSNGCVGSDAVTVTVNPLPTVNAGNDITLCNQPIGVQLAGFTPAGGTWSGSPNVTAGGLFTPSGNGVFNLTYTFTNANGCTNSDVMVVTVGNPIAANAGPDQSACINSGAFQLVPVTPGGTWSGTNVTAGGMFTPAIAQTYTLTYTLGAASCQTTDQVQIVVNSLPVANAGADVAFCVGGNVQLNGSANGGLAPYTSTVWNNAASLSNANILNPVASPAVNTTYTLTVTDSNGCIGIDGVAVTVNPLPTVNAGTDITLCDQPIPAQLAGFSPAGGTWGGNPNVTPAGVFTPNGAGAFNLTYTFTNANGCTNSDIVQVTVTGFVVADAGPNTDICVGAPAFNLVPVTPGGTWSGPNVNAAGLFTPNTAGNITVTYSIGTGTCLTTDQLTVTVHALPTAQAGPDQAICIGTVLTINGTGTTANPPLTSLVWTGNILNNLGNGVITVSPAVASNYTLTVTDNEGCVGTDVVTVNVNPLPVVNAGADITLCNQPIGQQLVGFSPAGGTWSGNPNVTAGGLFTPNGTGSFILTYTFMNANNCVNNDQIVITVNDPVQANAGPDEEICHNAAPIILVPVTPGGTWSGTNINAGGTFTPAIVQTYTLTYSLGAGTCLTTDQADVVVHPLPSITMPANTAVCYNECMTLTTTQLSGFTTFFWTINGVQIPDDQFCPADYPNIAQGAVVQACLNAENQFGCTNVGCYNITVSQLPGFPVLPSPICLNAMMTLPNCPTCNDYVVDFEQVGNPAVTLTANFPGNYFFPDAGDFDYVITSQLGACSDTQSGQTHIISLADVSLLTDPLVYDTCHPDFDADFEILGEGTQFSWIEPQYVNLAGQNGSTHTFHFDYDNFIDTDTIYFNTITATNVCNSVSETIQIDHMSLPFFSVDTDPSYCHGDEMFLVIKFNIPTTLTTLTITSDYPAIGTMVMNQAPVDTLWFPANSPLAVLPVNIQVVAENPCGQVVINELVNIYPPGFAVDLILDYPSPLCPGGIIDAEIVEFTGSASGITFPLNPNYTVVPTGPLTYLIEISSTVTVDTLDITAGINSTCGFNWDIEPVLIGPFTEPLWVNEPVCPGELVDITNLSNPVNSSFTWSMNSEVFSPYFVPSPVESDFYGNTPVTLTAAFPGYCTASYTSIVTAHPPITAAFDYLPGYITTMDPLVYFYSTTPLGAQYNWTFDNLGTSFGPQPAFTFPDAAEGTYEVCLQVTSAFGCTDIICRNLTVIDEFQMYVPTAFTPTDDGRNEVFKPVVHGYRGDKYSFKIFDRWGNKIFETDDYDEPWIGNVNGGNYYAQEDVYVWLVLVTDKQGTEHKAQGHVTLIR